MKLWQVFQEKQRENDLKWKTQDMTSWWRWWPLFPEILPHISDSDHYLDSGDSAVVVKGGGQRLQEVKGQRKEWDGKAG